MDFSEKLDERSRRPVGLPVTNPTESFWQCPPDDIATLRCSELPSMADVIIIGSGITGAAVAWGLQKEETNVGKTIVMLEAREACSGASGRNGGHTKAASYRSFLEHADAHGTAVATQIARLELSNIKALHAFAAAHSIPCDSNPCQTVDIVYDPAQWDYAHRAVAAMRDAMPGDEASEYSLHSADVARSRFFCGDNEGGGDETAVCGAVEYFAGSISAYQFGIGVLKLCLAKGLNLQTRTPALSVTKTVDGLDGYRWVVETPRGTITARDVVLATNGYTAFLRKQFQGIIVPLRGQVTAQRPGTRMPKSGLPTTYSFIYEGGYEYMVPRPTDSLFSGGIVIGGGLTKAAETGLEEYGSTDDASLNPVISNYLRDVLPRYFGKENWGHDHEKGRIYKEWTGIMGYSPDGFPFVGELPREKGLWICACFQGHGMVYCWESARALVELMCGRDGDELKAWFPDAFRVKEERFGQKFEGRLHTSVEKDLGQASR